MKTYRYYKFTAPEVLAAARAHLSARIELQRQGDLVAREFGGVASYYGGVHGSSFAGLKFSPRLDSPLWCKPDRNGLQRPRASVPAAIRAESAALKERWKAFAPTMKADVDELLAACGTDWSSLLFAGYGWVITDSAVFMATSLDLTAHGQEITGGEYQAAQDDKRKQVPA